ncbi:Beta-galactosidase [Lacunisphaera limnophila]|uniref:beta-galactosidase n=1 Tax=Lacunisphaera limnophila TaxID=1838286 RepID=A0A1D8ATJ3_9BACT|nr:glycoside hydrolase family 2 [Lacunisphaera limnophila]AOS44218.1 Beta-galactosidase [Lacunisphaera limnophila]
MSLRHFPLVLALISGLAAGARETEVRYLSGTGPENAVPWEFLCTGGRNSGIWTTIPVPSCWEQQGFGTYNYGVHHRPSKDKPNPPPLADEEGHYRHTFRVPAEWRDRAVRLVFDGVMTDAEVTVNGRSAGPVHQGSFYRFHHDITALLDFEGENRLEVVVRKKSANESVNRAERLGDYWLFGGIFRPVWLEARPRAAIEWTGIDARADGTFTADIHFGAAAAVAGRVTGVLVDQYDHELSPPLSAAIPAGAAKATLSGRFENLALWTAETPNLHRMRFTYSPEGGEPHTVTERFGFRTFEVRPQDGLYLNGTKIILKGVNRHCFNPDTGRTISRAQSYADARLIKEMNLNAVRMSHYQPDKHFLEACDELGLYVLNELAGWQGAYDTPTGTRLIGQLVRRDVNHPSILFWDNGNEGGWNTEVDGEFAKWDIQQRAVLHPWAKFSGVDTDHYEVWDSHVKKSAGPMLYMPTEFLHGLYDGGIGVGFRDYWDVMKKSPTVVGGFFWVFADEGIARTDQAGRIDNAGNLAPDGIVGPRGEKEGSFYTVKEIWSPVQISLPAVLPPGWTGADIRNEYQFTDLASASFRWEWLRAGPEGETLIEAADQAGPVLAPGASGILPSPLVVPAGAEFLRLTAFAAGQVVTVASAWTGPVAAPPPAANAAPAGAPDWLGEPTVLALRRQDRRFEPVPAATNPVFRWTRQPDGALRLDYEFTYDGPADVLGIRFPVAEARLQAKRWLGHGPYRVWQNRLEGGWLGVHAMAFNDATPGESWAYPEFKGCFRDWRWLSLLTPEGWLQVTNLSGVPFFGLGRPRDGVNGLYAMPDLGLSFLEVIPAMRNKFHSPEQLGPQSRTREVAGIHRGSLLFRLDRP